MVLLWCVLEGSSSWDRQEKCAVSEKSSREVGTDEHGHSRRDGQWGQSRCVSLLSDSGQQGTYVRICCCGTYMHVRLARETSQFRVRSPLILVSGLP